MNFRQKVAVAILDAAIIVEVCIGIYLGSRNPENLTPIFLKSFFAMAIPTLAFGMIIVRRLRTPAGGLKT
ncbi:MAG: hypothetical protein GX443_14200 [Deltaproteobacteria bacterium]|nr:hypothetical protein [Deltaproteobacteria bacterium]